MTWLHDRARTEEQLHQLFRQAETSEVQAAHDEGPAASLRVTHPSMRSDELCAALGLAAYVRWNSGDARLGLDGRVLKGVQAESCCVFRVPVRSKETFDEDLIEFLSPLARRSKEVESMLRQGAWSLSLTLSAGLVVDAAVIALLGRLQMGLMMDPVRSPTSRESGSED